MKNSNSQPFNLYTNTHNIEKAINEVFDYTTREELSYEVQDAFDNVMAEVYDMRRNIKTMMSERVDELKRKRNK
jgi:hypothetical protein